jgi:hypothetical protein
MVGEMQAGAVISAGVSACLAIDHLHEIPMHARLVWAEASNEFGDIEYRMPPAGEAVDRKPRAGFEFLAKGVFYERKFHRHGDPREMEGVAAPRGLYSLGAVGWQEA